MRLQLTDHGPTQSTLLLQRKHKALARPRRRCGANSSSGGPPVEPVAAAGACRKSNKSWI